MILMIRKSGLVKGAILLAILLVILAGVVTAARMQEGRTAAVSADGNWGLSFQTEGLAPIGNASAEYLKKYERAKKKDIRDLLWDKLPNALNDTQKENKIRNLLSSMKKKDIIEPNSSNQQKSYWVLKK